MRTVCCTVILSCAIDVEVDVEDDEDIREAAIDEARWDCHGELLEVHDVEINSETSW